MTTPNPLIIIIWTCQEMMVWMRMELIGFVDVIMLDFGLEVGQMASDFCPALTTNLTQHDSHRADDRTPKPLIIIIRTCQEMMVWMRMQLIGSQDVIMLDFGLEVGQMAADFLPSPDHKSDPA
jgi:hypothetical protein